MCARVVTDQPPATERERLARVRVGLGVGFSLGGGSREWTDTRLSVTIRDRATGQALWEGRAESRDNAKKKDADAANVAPRFFAFILLIFVAVVTFYVHDFWNQSGGSERLNDIVHVMKNISIIGALLMIIGYRPVIAHSAETSYHDGPVL